MANMTKTPYITDDISMSPLILDPEHPMSIHRMVPSWLSDRIQKINPELFLNDEKEFRKKLHPGLTHDALRISFWTEYSAAMMGGRSKLELSRVWGGICSLNYFQSVTAIEGYLAYMLTPPKKYVSSLRAIMEISIERMHEIANMDLRNEDGQVDVKKAALVIKLHEVLSNRLGGMPVQRIMTANVQLGKQMMNEELDSKEEYLNQRIIQLRSRARQLSGEIEDEGIQVTSAELEDSNSGDTGSGGTNSEGA